MFKNNAYISEKMTYVHICIISYTVYRPQSENDEIQKTDKSTKFGQYMAK